METINSIRIYWTNFSPIHTTKSHSQMEIWRILWWIKRICQILINHVTWERNQWNLIIRNLRLKRIHKLQIFLSKSDKSIIKVIFWIWFRSQTTLLSLRMSHRCKNFNSRICNCLRIVLILDQLIFSKIIEMIF